VVGAAGVRGLSLPQLPEGAGGRGWSREQVVERDDLFARRNVVAPPTGLGVLMGAPVVVGDGTSEQVARLVPPLAAGTRCGASCSRSRVRGPTSPACRPAPSATATSGW
jgi:alkylation response protein AidB-like acyl-CoA dehydrogenase